MPYVELQIDPIRQARRQSRCKCAIGKDGRKADTERGHAEGWRCCLRHRYRKIPVPLKRKGHGAGLSSADCQSRSCRTSTAGGRGLQGGCKKYRRAGHHHGWRAALNDGGWSPPACATNKGQRPVQCHLAGATVPRASVRPCGQPEKEKPRKSENLRGLFRHFWRRRRDSNPRSRFWPRCSLSRGVPSTSRPRLPNFRSHQGGSATRRR